MSDTRQDPVSRFGMLVQLARRARQSVSEDALWFVAVNESRQLLEYRQSAVWIDAKGVAAVSGLPEPVSGAPYVQWLAGACQAWRGMDGASPVTADSLPPSLARDWSEWLPSHGLVLPMKNRKGRLLGLWLLAREQPWDESEIAIANELADIYGHAWQSFMPKLAWREQINRRLGGGAPLRKIALAILLIGVVPVRLTVLAPAEVAAKDPFFVRAPAEGVIDSFHVRPNSPVKVGQPLFDLDSSGMRTRLSVARKSFEAASEEYRQAAQLALVDDERGKLDMVVRRGKMEEKAAELDYSKHLLDRIQIRSPREGVVVFADPNDWIGKAVSVGERVMQVADPSKVEIVIRLAVGDAIELPSGAEVTLYLTTAPRYSYGATLSYAAYKADVGADGILSYKLKADFRDDEVRPRLGQTGTAKLYGDWVLLCYYVARRPLAAARQWLGW